MYVGSPAFSSVWIVFSLLLQELNWLSFYSAMSYADRREVFVDLSSGLKASKTHLFLLIASTMTD